MTMAVEIPMYPTMLLPRMLLASMYGPSGWARDHCTALHHEVMTTPTMVPPTVATSSDHNHSLA